MNISIVGSGNVANVLAKLIVSKGHTIQQIISRNKIAGKELANAIECEYIPFNAAYNTQIDLCIIAISDYPLNNIFTLIKFGTIPVVHTAGAVNMNVLGRISENFGVLYPLQTLSKEMHTIPPIPFLIEANNESTYALINQLAQTLSTKVVAATDEERIKLHLGAVYVNNFVNHIYAKTEQYCIDEEVNFNLLKPIIVETANKILETSPLDAQTGPAIRHDIQTIEKHLKLLSKYPKLKTLYTRMSDGIMNG